MSNNMSTYYGTYAEKGEQKEAFFVLMHLFIWKMPLSKKKLHLLLHGTSNMCLDKDLCKSQSCRAVGLKEGKQAENPHFIVHLGLHRAPLTH